MISRDGYCSISDNSLPQLLIVTLILSHGNDEESHKIKEKVPEFAAE